MKKILSLILCLTLCLALIPSTTVFAANIASGDGWYIDATGCLHITGAIHNTSDWRTNNSPFHPYAERITSCIAYSGSSIDSGIFLFDECTEMVTCDLSQLKTKGVKEMRGMFLNCWSLEELNVSNFNTSSVLGMQDMFVSCTELETLDLRSFDTSNVTTMDSMFERCSNLRDLDISSFNTRKLEVTSNMFRGCSSLKSIDISGFDTSNLKNCYKMFENCVDLKYLDLSNFNTAALEETDSFVDYCHRLDSLTVNADVISTFGDQIFNLSIAWHDVNSDAVYLSAAELKTIRSTTTIARGADITSGDGWYLDDDGCLHITGAVHNPSDGRTNRSPFLFCTEKIKSCIAHSGASIDNGAYLFCNCRNMVTCDLSRLGTANVTNMHNMFASCASLTELDVSNFNTSSVTEMDGMFHYDINLRAINVSSFDTSKVTDMSDMFGGCSSLVELDLSNFDVLRVENMIRMFADCFKLKRIDLSNFYTYYLSNCNSMFKNCYALQYLDFSKFFSGKLNEGTPNTEDFLKDCGNLRGITLDDSITSTFSKQILAISSSWHDVNGNAVYTSVSDLKNIKTLTTIARPNVSAIGEGWYIDDVNRLHITGAVANPISNEDCTPWKDYKNKIKTVVAESGASVNNAGNLFRNCPKLVSVDLKKLDLSAATNMAYMFSGCSSLASLDVSSFDTSNVTDMGMMFSGCSSLTTLDLSAFNTASVKSMVSMLYGCSSLKTLDIGNFSTARLQTAALMLGGCNSLVEIKTNGAMLTEIADQLMNISAGWKNKSTGKAYTTETALKAISGNVVLVKDADIAVGTNWYIDASGCLHITGAVNYLKTYYDTTPWKAYKSQIKAVVTTPGASVNNGAFLFSDCVNLVTADLYYLDTSAVTEMNYMFQNCKNMISVDVSNFNTSAVLNMAYMFDGCEKLSTVDVSWFDTYNVENMSAMFRGCTSLTELDVSHFDTRYVEYMTDMFNYCSLLEVIDVSNFNTENVYDMQRMFIGCRRLQKLDVSNFNMRFDPDLDDIFFGANSLVFITVQDSVMEPFAETLMSLSDSWRDQSGERFYSSVSSLLTIQNKTTLLRAVKPIGDVNEDGRVDSADLAHLRWVLLMGIQSASCDVNRDGRVDVRDLVALKKILAQ